MGWLWMLLANLSGQALPVPAVDHLVFGPIRAIYRPKAGCGFGQNLPSRFQDNARRGRA
jgi:hypothetical protein